MPLPNINIIFTNAASATAVRSNRGVAALIIRDTAANGAHILTNAAQIPAALGAENKAYIERAFLGYVNTPRKVIVFVQPADSENLSAGLDYLETQTFDYLAGPPDISAAERSAVVSWIQAQRAAGYVPKAVLPDIAANSEAVINFTTSDIKIGEAAYTAAQYCSRIAGLVTGTPLNISCTYALLPEVADIGRLSKSEMDAAIDAGEFILMHDGEKVKVGRGVNSLTTTTDSKGESFKKIKIAETVDLIQRDLKLLAQDNYIGKYANTYDNKCVLISAIKDYFTGLEMTGVLKRETSSVGIDMQAQEAFLQSQGIDTSKMSEKDIKTAATADKVFLEASISILDAIEDITLGITI